MQLLIVANSVETFWIAKSQLRISQGILQGSLLRRPRGGGDSGRSPILIVRQGRKGTKPSKDDCLGLSEVESKHLVKCTRFLEIYHIESIHVYTYYEYMIWLQNDSLDPKKTEMAKNMITWQTSVGPSPQAHQPKTRLVHAAATCQSQGAFALGVGCSLEPQNHLKGRGLEPFAEKIPFPWIFLCDLGVWNNLMRIQNSTVDIQL